MNKNRKGGSKIKNATPSVYDGIRFKSKLEVFAYRKFKEKGINLEYEAVRFELQEGFTFNGEKVLPITFKPDFTNSALGIVIEIKGYSNDAFPLRWKMFKYVLAHNPCEYKRVYVLKNQKEVLDCLDQILEEMKDVD